MGWLQTMVSVAAENEILKGELSKLRQEAHESNQNNY
jgi:hypothetical protein